ncbi:MAG: S8 family serine peptidase [Candidatus Sericytochromatia bacterium]|nr:S8 family serine peptidase [Candidatus Tanganyikabacteria bacterium]
MSLRIGRWPGSHRILRSLPALLALVSLSACGAPLVTPALSQSSSAREAERQLSGRTILRRAPGVDTGAFRQWLGKQGLREVRNLPELGASIVVGRSMAAWPKAWVATAEPERVRRLVRPARTSRTSRILLPARVLASLGDPLVPQQWALETLGARRAWQVTRGSRDIIVAVIDTGVDLGHPDLRTRLVAGINTLPDATTPGQEGPIGPADDNGHGTHVAGIIAAEGGNGQGIVGLAPGCRVMPVKVLAGDTTGRDADVAAGIVWAVQHGARVLNLSLGGAGGSRLLADAITMAHAQGALIVAAMGNDGVDPMLGDEPNYPAALPETLAVGATGQTDEVAAFSNRGRWMSVAAPGEGILSTTPTYPVYDPVSPDYDYLDGTSMATPYVSAAAALAWAVRPDMRADALKDRIEQTAVDVAAPGFDRVAGHGRLDAARLVESLR